MRFVKFVGVGGIATGIHYLILMLLVELDLTSAVVGTTIGYFISSLFNYLANYYFTFGSKAKHHTAALKFYSVAGLGLLLNAVIVFAVNDYLGAHYLAAQLAATLVVMCWNYLAHKHWTYVSA